MSAHGALVGAIPEVALLSQRARVGAIPAEWSLAQGALVGAIPAAGSLAQGALVGAMSDSLDMLDHGAVIDVTAGPPFTVLGSRKVVSGGALGSCCEGFQVAETREKEKT